jgi:hypothetical protein
MVFSPFSMFIGRLGEKNITEFNIIQGDFVLLLSKAKGEVAVSAGKIIAESYRFVVFQEVIQEAVYKASAGFFCDFLSAWVYLLASLALVGWREPIFMLRSQMQCI